MHVDAGGIWLLLDWWSEGDRLLHRELRASIDNPTRFVDGGPHPVGRSVWDLAVQAHERAAWLRHVLANPDGPDLKAYLADGLTGTF